MNPELKRLREKRHRDKDPDAYRAYHRAWAAKRTIEQKLAKRDYNRRYLGYPEPTRPCPDVCECCSGPFTGKKGPHLDHDHQTGRFRGWLCSRCNLGIGALGDTESGVSNALKYLRVVH
jgi:hypothetical protein